MNHINGLLFWAQINNGLSFRSVYATWPMFYGAIFHKQTPEGDVFDGLLPSVLSLKLTPL